MCKASSSLSNAARRTVSIRITHLLSIMLKISHYVNVVEISFLTKIL